MSTDLIWETTTEQVNESIEGIDSTIDPAVDHATDGYTVLRLCELGKRLGSQYK